MPNESKLLHFVLEKQTKGALRYRELNDPATIGTLYVRKDQIEGSPATLAIMFNVQDAS